MSFVSRRSYTRRSWRRFCACAERRRKARRLFFLLVVVVSRRRVARLVTRFKKRFIDVRAGSRLNREDPETDASLSERLLGDARNDGNGDARGATDAPPETLREAKKKYRGPSDDADDDAHELV
mmetsp:Transcript_13064/g.54869  ORF Transcript_13064/g.54869 Transcript_13064/m.54869 type:complete len:124 (-) Transcript_13064:456-827(-)